MGKILQMKIFVLFLLPVVLCGCAVLDATGEAAGVVGKTGWAAIKAVGSVAYAGTSMAGQTANQTNKTLTRPSGRLDEGISVSGSRSVIPMEQEGKSYFVRAKINGKVSGRFLFDTGASAVQISKTMAKRLGLEKKKSQAIPVTLAGGAVVAGRMVVIDDIQMGSMIARNVKAIILDYEHNPSSDGLLGMSFLENFIFQIDTQKSRLILEKR